MYVYSPGCGETIFTGSKTSCAVMGGAVKGRIDPFGAGTTFAGSHDLSSNPGRFQPAWLSRASKSSPP